MTRESGTSEEGLPTSFQFGDKEIVSEPIKDICEKGYSLVSVFCNYVLKEAIAHFTAGFCAYNSVNKNYQGRVDSCDCIYKTQDTCENTGSITPKVGLEIGYRSCSLSITKLISIDKLVTGKTYVECKNNADNLCKDACKTAPSTEYMECCKKQQ